MKKVLRVTKTQDPASGGPIEGIKQSINYLNEHGFSTSVASLDRKTSWFLQNTSYESFPLGHSPIKYGYNHSAYKKLLDVAKDFHVIIVDGIWQYHSIIAYKVAKKLGIPLFIFPHGMLDPWFQSQYPLKHLKKMLYWKLFESSGFAAANGILYTCEKELELAIQSFSPYPANNFVAGFGISLPPQNKRSLREAFLSHYPQLRNKEVFLFMGRLHEKKGIDNLIKAYAAIKPSHNDLHLVIAGPDTDNLKHKLMMLAESLGVSHCITWTGMLSGNLKWGAFYASSLFCLPSHQENFGIVLAEALGCGLPVSTTKSVNISNEILLQSAGFVNEDSTQGAIDGISSWLKQSQEQKALMMASARSLFDNQFDLDTVSTRLANLLRSSL